MRWDALPRLLAVSCLAAAQTVIAPRVVTAQAAELAGIELSYEASPGCPERDAFVKNLEARRRGAPAGTATDTVRLEVRLALGDRVEGTIAVLSASGARSARSVEAATCAEAADALAFIATLALVGIQVEQTAPEETPADQAGTRRPRARRAPAERDSATETADASEQDAGEQASAETDTASEPAPQPSAVAEAKPAEETTSELEAVEVRESERASRAHLMLAGGAGSGVLPVLQPLLELSLSVDNGGDGALRVSAQAGVRVSPDQTRAFDMGTVSFGWWSGVGALCLGAGGTRLSASGCAVVEAGTVAASASETDNPRNELRAWVAVGPGLSVALDVTRALRLQLRAEGLLPLARYRFELPRESAVHEPSQLGLRIGLGAGLRLW